MKKRQLLSIGTNAKTVKGNKLGFLTGVMYLAPSDLSGFQVCPMAKMARCEDPCLYKSGRGVFTSTQTARIGYSDGYHDGLIESLAQLTE